MGDPVNKNEQIDPVKRHTLRSQSDRHTNERDRINQRGSDQDIPPSKPVDHKTREKEKDEDWENKHEPNKSKLECVTCDLIDMPPKRDCDHLHR